jgi:hypothetical protein
MTLEDRVQAQRLHVFRRAEELGTVHSGALGLRRLASISLTASR